MKEIGYENNHVVFKIDKGYFDVMVEDDGEYQGIDVEFVANEENDQNLSRPRILFEFANGKLRALIWNDKNNEDYSFEIEFD